MGMKNPEPVDIIIAGTSCKCASKLNIHQKDRLNTLTSGSGSTSSTFLGLLQASLAPDEHTRISMFRRVPHIPQCTALCTYVRTYVFLCKQHCNDLLVFGVPCEVVQSTKERCKLVVLENVTGLSTPDASGRSNLDAAREAFNSLGARERHLMMRERMQACTYVRASADDTVT